MAAISFGMVWYGLVWFGMVWLGREEVGGAPVRIPCNYLTG